MIPDSPFKTPPQFKQTPSQPKNQTNQFTFQPGIPENPIPQNNSNKDIEIPIDIINLKKTGWQDLNNNK